MRESRELSTCNPLNPPPPHDNAAEIIKYGLIRDAPLFEWLEQNMDRLLNRDPEVGRERGGVCEFVCVGGGGEGELLRSRRLQQVFSRWASWV
jgi:hypothetical protein